MFRYGPEPVAGHPAGKRKQEQDIVVMGSASVVRTLIAHHLADEYRLLALRDRHALNRGRS